MIGNAGQDVGKPFARVDVVQFAGLDQRVDGGCALTSASPRKGARWKLSARYMRN
jgi:hypothetical protein